MEVFMLVSVMWPMDLLFDLTSIYENYFNFMKFTYM